jgi:hypothetical protein
MNFQIDRMIRTTDEDHAALLPVRTEGTSTWVCTRCLPALIHG